MPVRIHGSRPIEPPFPGELAYVIVPDRETLYCSRSAANPEPDQKVLEVAVHYASPGKGDDFFEVYKYCRKYWALMHERDAHSLFKHQELGRIGFYPSSRNNEKYIRYDYKSQKL